MDDLKRSSPDHGGGIIPRHLDPDLFLFILKCIMSPKKMTARSTARMNKILLVLIRIGNSLKQMHFQMD